MKIIQNHINPGIIKVLTVLAFYAAMVCIESCCQVIPYFDYTSLRLDSYFSYNLKQDTIGGLWIIPENINHLGAVPSVGLVGQAYALSCESDGYMGAKYPATKIEITADQDLNDTLPAGALLNSLFYWDFDFKTRLDDGLAYLFNSDISEYGDLLLYSYSSPDTSQVFEITVKITKSNGSIAEGKLKNFKFK